MSRVRALLVLALALVLTPALVTAGNVTGPLTGEQHLVEGHTVFTVLEEEAARGAVGATARGSAGASAPTRVPLADAASRFHGVLWFNDQYLTAPLSSAPAGVHGRAAALAVLVRDVDDHGAAAPVPVPAIGRDRPVIDDRTSGARYPCGGAVLVANAADPGAPGVDPRVTLARLAGEDVVLATTNAALWGEDASRNADDAPRALVDVNGTRASTTLTSALEYVHSYLVTDPNDHAWVIDRYTALVTTTIDAATGNERTARTPFPFWVVNVGGGAAFTPDDGVTSCSPFVDAPSTQGVVEQAFVHADATTCAASRAVTTICPSKGPGFNLADADADGVPTDGLDARPPALGYYAPTDTQGGVAPKRCYSGHDAPRDALPGAGCAHAAPPVPPRPGESAVTRASGPRADADARPHRLYNAVLQIPLGPDAARVIGEMPHLTGDTNGCAPGTEWPCPDENGDGVQDADAQGYSHPFNPPGLYRPAYGEVNGNRQAGDWTDVHARTVGRACSEGYDADATDAHGNPVCVVEEHKTHLRSLVDVWFTPRWRPPEPAARVFVLAEAFGSDDAYHENNRRVDWPETTPPYHPGAPDA